MSWEGERIRNMETGRTDIGALGYVYNCISYIICVYR